MANKIVIQIEEENSNRNPLNWIKIDDEGTTLEQGQLSHQQLLDKSEQWQHQDIIVIAPGSDCLFIEANIPAKKMRQIKAAFPFTVEENLSQPIEQLHFAIGGCNEQGLTTALVVDETVMEHWLQPFLRAELLPKLMVASHQIIPRLENAYHLFIQHNMAFVKAPDDTSFSCELELLARVLQPPKLEGDVTEGEDTRPKLLIESDKDVDATLINALSEYWQIEQILVEDGLLFLARNLTQSKITNLMQDKFKAKAKASKIWQTWRLPTIAAGVAITIQLLSWSLDYWQLSSQKQALKSAQLKIYKSVFPKQKRISNPVRLMRSRLKKYNTTAVSSNFLPLLEKYSEASQQVTITQLTSLVYRAKRGEMNISYIAPDLATIEKFQNTLRKLHLDVKPGASNAVDKGYSGQMIIKEKS